MPHDFQELKIPTQEVSLDRIRAIFGDVKELYRFLTLECELHFPGIEFTNARWMFMIWKGQKKVSANFPRRDLVQALKVKDAVPLRLPQIEGLKIADILEYLSDKGHEVYLPIPTKRGMPVKYSRPWLISVRTLTLDLTFL